MQEVAYSDFFELANKPWHTVARAKDVNVAKALSQSMREACDNQNIGYAQYGTADRYGLYDQVANGIKIKDAQPCNCDCSSLIAAVCLENGIKTSRWMDTAGEKDILAATKAFDILEFRGKEFLKQGDILIAKGHTEIVVWLESEFILDGMDYSVLFDPEYYLAKYPDLRQAFGTDTEQAWKHFVNFGMDEGRQAKENFNVWCYRARYPDLFQAFRTDVSKYYRHFVEFGRKEGRSGNLTEPKYFITPAIPTKLFATREMTIVADENFANKRLTVLMVDGQKLFGKTEENTFGWFKI